MRAFSRRRPYLAALFFILASAGLRDLLNPAFGRQLGFMVFVPAIVAASLLGGIGPGIWSVVLAAVIADVFFVEPPGQIWPINAEDLPVMTAGLAASIGVVLLVHYRNRADAKARASEERFRAAQDLSLDAFTILEAVRDPAGTIVDFQWKYANAAAGAILKHPPERLIGRRLLELLPANKASGLFDAYARVVETGEPHDLELRYDADGIDGWYRNMAVKLRDGVAVSFRNITEEKRIRDHQEFLLDASERLAATLEFDGTVATIGELAVRLADWVAFATEVGDQHGTLFTRTFSAQPGPFDEALGHVSPALFSEAFELVRSTRLPRVVAPASPEKIRKAVADQDLAARAVEAGVQAWMLLPLVAGGRTLGVLALIARNPERCNDDALRAARQFAYRAALALDNSRLFVQAQVARASAESANRMKDVFLATVSHELRTPLNAILGWIQVIEQQHENPERVRHALDVIRRNASAQTAIVSDLLDVSRIARGRVELHTERLALAPLLEEVAESVAPSLRTKSLTLTMSVSADLPEVLADRDRIVQVFWNLMVNAVKFTPAGGWIRLTAERHDHGARIEVVDSGVGLSRHQLTSVFEPFVQADASSTRQFGGLGLGLSIVRQLVDLHGGTVEALSDGPGTGATFRVCLPPAPAASAAVAPLTA